MPSCRLNDIPEEVYNHLIDEQSEVKKKQKANISLERVVFRIIREHKRFKEELATLRSKK